jgi:uncharacterized phage protein (TIGR01671 family)
MREIKFRAWYKPKKKMYTLSLESINFETKLLGVYTIGEGYQQLRISDFELMQYTGLKDKNGKEIYEGDLLDCNGGIGKVVYLNEEAAFRVELNVPHACWFDSLDIWADEEIIGNIYENPELVEDRDGGLLKCYESGTL